MQKNVNFMSISGNSFRDIMDTVTMSMEYNTEFVLAVAAT